MFYVYYIVILKKRGLSYITPYKYAKIAGRKMSESQGNKNKSETSDINIYKNTVFRRIIILFSLSMVIYSFVELIRPYFNRGSYSYYGKDISEDPNKKDENDIDVYNSVLESFFCNGGRKATFCK